MAGLRHPAGCCIYRHGGRIIAAWFRHDLVRRLLPALASVLAWSVGSSRAEPAKVITDAGEVAGYLANFNANRRLPENYRIVFHIDRLDAGVRHWRTDEWVKVGENAYWKREYQGRPSDPVTRNETLVMPGPNDRPLAWETNQARVPAASHHRPRMPDTPTGDVRFEAGKANNVRLQVEGDRALLTYREIHPPVDGGDISRSYELDLRAGVFREGKSIFHGRGNIEEHRWTEVFDTAPRLAPDHFEQIRSRLEKGGQLAVRNAVLLQQANSLALLLGATLPVVLAFVRYRRALRPQDRRNLLIGAAAFFAGVPVLLALLSLALSGREVLVMFLLSIPWALVGNVLPRELAWPVSQFIAAALVTMFLSALVSVALQRKAVRQPPTP